MEQGGKEGLIRPRQWPKSTLGLASCTQVQTKRLHHKQQSATFSFHSTLPLRFILLISVDSKVDSKSACTCSFLLAHSTLSLRTSHFLLILIPVASLQGMWRSSKQRLGRMVRWAHVRFRTIPGGGGATTKRGQRHERRSASGFWSKGQNGHPTLCVMTACTENVSPPLRQSLSIFGLPPLLTAHVQSIRPRSERIGWQRRTLCVQRRGFARVRVDPALGLTPLTPPRLC